MIRRHRQEHGAVSLIVLVLMVILVLALAVAMLMGQARTAEERAWSGAEAVAHGVALAANGLARRDDLSIQTQGGRDCARGTLKPSADYQTAEDDLCTPLYRAADDLGGHNDVEVVGILIGPNLHDQNGPPAPGRIDVLVAVRADGPLAFAEPICAGGPYRPSDWCDPEAAMGAELVE